jgi:inorganic pyrophosphatase
MDFWETLDNFLTSGEVVIDRPKGSSHPRFPEIVYPLGYGYLKGVFGGDGNELDVWQGSMTEKRLVAVACTVDTMKKDVEAKLLIGCTEEEINIVDKFHNSKYMSCVIIRRKELPQA